MKRLKLLLLVFIVLPISGMSQTVITYSYDAAGNRTTRTSSIEVAAVAEPQAITESKILEFDFRQELLYCSKEIYHVLRSDNGDMSGKELIGNPSVQKHQFFLCSVDYPAIITQIINTKHKRI